MTNFKFSTLAIFAISLFASSGSISQKLTTTIPSLKDTFKGDFYAGTALNNAQIEEKRSKVAVFIPQQFNAITPENIMKCEIIHPEWNKYNFDMADKFVAYGKKHNMFIVGHNLLLHSQLSPFISKIQRKNSLLLFMTNHINTVAGRYAGQINGWDVVNEALDEDGTIRKSIFRIS